MPPVHSLLLRRKVQPCAEPRGCDLGRPASFSAPLSTGRTHIGRVGIDNFPIAVGLSALRSGRSSRHKVLHTGCSTRQCRLPPELSGEGRRGYRIFPGFSLLCAGQEPAHRAFSPRQTRSASIFRGVHCTHINSTVLPLGQGFPVGNVPQAPALHRIKPCPVPLGSWPRGSALWGSFPDFSAG